MQLLAAIYTIALPAVVSFVLLWLISKTTARRVSESQEREWIDLAEHGESACN